MFAGKWSILSFSAERGGQRWEWPIVCLGLLFFILFSYKKQSRVLAYLGPGDTVWQWNSAKMTQGESNPCKQWISNELMFYLKDLNDIVSNFMKQNFKKIMKKLQIQRTCNKPWLYWKRVHMIKTILIIPF